MKTIQINFPESDVTVTANLLVEREPELCQQLWDAIETPSRMVCHHTISTGDVFVAFPRPPKEPPVTGTQAKPVGRHTDFLWSDLQPGDIFWRGWNCGVAYGPCTEPMNPGGCLAAQVILEDMDRFVAACKNVWYTIYFHHQTPSIVISRKEN